MNPSENPRAVEALMEAAINDRGKELGALDSDEAKRWLTVIEPFTREED